MQELFAALLITNVIFPNIVADNRNTVRPTSTSLTPNLVMKVKLTVIEVSAVQGRTNANCCGEKPVEVATSNAI